MWCRGGIPRGRGDHEGDGNVRGLNTAATLWGAAAVGACAGADLLLEAILAALFVLAGNTLLRPLVKAINRQPLDDRSSEVSYLVCVICNRQRQKEARERLEALLAAANYPVSAVHVYPFMGNEVQIFATLLSTAVDSDELDGIIERLTAAPAISQAYWTASTTE